MADPLGGLVRFLTELRRRKVYRAAAVYLVVALASLELVDALVPATTLPAWADELFVALAILGFPLVLAIAWAYDITPGGVRKTTSGEGTTADVDPGGIPTATSAPNMSDTGSGSEATDLDTRVVAVLPFDNLGGAPDAAPFAAGLHDDLLTELSRVSALTVISRTSAQGMSDTGLTVREIGRALGAGTVIEGGVQKSGERVRLNVQLIDTRTDVHRWAERYDRELTTENIFDIQSELAEKIVDTLRAALAPVPTESPTSGGAAFAEPDDPKAIQPRGHAPTQDLEAYRLYARGRDVFAERTSEAMREATGYFEQAVERDPGYAPAWAALANALILSGDYGYADAEVVLPRGEAAARRALELDSTLAEAHGALGNLHSLGRRCPEALRHHMTAVELQASYAQGHQWVSWVRLLAGDPDGGRRAGRRAVSLDPLDPEARSNLAVAHLGCGDPESALVEGRRVLERAPAFDYARWIVALALDEMNREEDAWRQLEQLSEPWAVSWPETARALALAGKGDRSGALHSVETLRSQSSWFHVGLVEAALGELDTAFEALGEASSPAWDETLCLRYYEGPPLSSLRPDPRFPVLMEHVDRSWGLEADSGGLSTTPV